MNINNLDNNIIKVSGLKKSFGNLAAVDGIGFEVERGGLFAFLGPNGAGKSTTIDMISTQLAPDSGSIEVDGFFVGKGDAEIRSCIGIVFQDSVLDQHLTVKENLAVRAAFYGLNGEARRTAVLDAAKTADVLEFLNRPYGKLSGGQRRRADIARALINTPSILFLDEPTTGLDPQTRKKVWETVRELQATHGMTIFLTTHYMEEAAQADNIVIIDHGKLLAMGTPAEMKEKYTADQLKIMPKDLQAIQNYFNGKKAKFSLEGGEIKISLKHTAEAIPMIAELSQYIAGFEVVRGSMEDVFLNLTGEGIRS